MVGKRSIKDKVIINARKKMWDWCAISSYLSGTHQYVPLLKSYHYNFGTHSPYKDDYVKYQPPEIMSSQIDWELSIISIIIIEINMQKERIISNIESNFPK
jgi:uncharacterized protein YijF (DUF1287 family)